MGVAAAQKLIQSQKRINNRKAATPHSMLLHAQRVSRGDDLSSHSSFSRLGDLLSEVTNTGNKQSMQGVDVDATSASSSHAKAKGGGRRKESRSFNSDKAKRLFKNIDAGDRMAPQRW